MIELTGKKKGPFIFRVPNARKNEVAPLRCLPLSPFYDLSHSLNYINSAGHRNSGSTTA